MPAYRTLATILLILTGTLASMAAHSDEVGEIAGKLEQGQVSAALTHAEDFLKAHPSDARAMFIKGLALAKLNKADDAIKVFTEITQKHPELPEPYNNLAVLYAERGQYDKARRALEAALNTHPSYATAHDNLAGIYAHMASQAYGKALQLDGKASKRSPPSSKLTMIQTLPVQSEPVMLASKATQTRASLKEAAESKASVATGGKLVKPAEPVKAVEPAKPEVVAAAKPEPATLNLGKATASLDQPANVKPAAEPASQPEAGKSMEAGVREAVSAWALAWSSQNVEKYLASYADSFKTPNGESRPQWEQTRRERISAPANIQVDITDLRIGMKGGGIAHAQFKQTYRTGATLMRTNKTLIFRDKGGKWLIEQERTDR